MGWRFHKSIKIAPGIKINIGKKGISSVSAGGRGAHINKKKKCTNLKTSIPGTGLYHVTRLDKPSGGGMTQCPYCGHRMRKQWDECPQCHAPLVQQVRQQEPINVAPSDNQQTIDTNAKHIDNSPPKENKGCGCLIIFIVLMLIGSCMSGTSSKESTTPKPTTAVTETTSSNVPKPVPVPAPSPEQETSKPSSPSNSAAAPAKSSPTNEKKYYGNGPNGEGIKGHIDNKKGTRIYHIPGSTYYSRTKHVSQWFFTEREAREAGYRAPYR